MRSDRTVNGGSECGRFAEVLGGRGKAKVLLEAATEGRARSWVPIAMYRSHELGLDSAVGEQLWTS